MTTSPRMLVRMLIILKTFNGIHLHHHDHGAISIFLVKIQESSSNLGSLTVFFLLIIESFGFQGSGARKEEGQCHHGRGAKKKLGGSTHWGLCLGFVASCHQGNPSRFSR